MLYFWLNVSMANIFRILWTSSAGTYKYRTDLQMHKIDIMHTRSKCDLRLGLLTQKQ